MSATEPEKDAETFAVWSPPEGKICRKCRGWGVISTPRGGGVFGTDDCRQCAGTGEES